MRRGDYGYKLDSTRPSCAACPGYVNWAMANLNGPDTDEPNVSVSRCGHPISFWTLLHIL